MDLTFGARLRSQRERQDIALATIAEETKISVALLEALERDDVSRWPGGLFRRAYVRTYAQKIGLDPEQVVREFLQLYPDPIEGTSPVEAFAESALGKRPRTRIGFLIAGLAGLRPQRVQAPQRVVTPEMFSVEDQPLVLDLAAPVAPEPVAFVEPEAEPEAELHEPELHEPESLHIAARLFTIPAPDATADTRRDLRTLEHDIVSIARLCTQIASARDDGDLSGALAEAVGILDAQGVILWVRDPDRDALFPVLAHGYPEELLSKLPEVRRCADNAIAAAFRCGQKQVVRGDGDATGAFVAPMLTPDGCAGVLALEFANGGEQQECVQALAMIVAAQVSTLFAAAPQAAIDEEWAQPDRSLVAS
jgi:transcriptional regulator with XRE-family HTH domain